MSGWVKTPADWLDHDDIEELGSDAVLLHLSALGYCARQMLNGRIPKRQLRRLWPVADLEDATARLVKADEWEDAGDDYYLPNWRTHILSADEVERLREQNRVRAERHRRHSQGDHSMCDRCSVVRAGNAVSNGVTNGVSNAPSEPNRAEPTRRGGGSAGGRSSPADAATTPDGEERELVRRLPQHHQPHPDCCNLPAEHPIHQATA